MTLKRRAQDEERAEKQAKGVKDDVEEKEEKDEQDEEQEILEGAPQMETPESPAPPPETLGLEAASQVPVGTSPASTYTNQNPAGSPAANYDIDTGVGSAPADRPSTFSPLGTGAMIPAPNDLTDSGQGSQMASRPPTADLPLTTQISIDPGLKSLG